MPLLIIEWKVKIKSIDIDNCTINESVSGDQHHIFECEATTTVLPAPSYNIQHQCRAIKSLDCSGWIFKYFSHWLCSLYNFYFNKKRQCIENVFTCHLYEYLYAASNQTQFLTNRILKLKYSHFMKSFDFRLSWQNWHSCS